MKYIDPALVGQATVELARTDDDIGITVTVDISRRGYGTPEFGVG